MQKSDKKLGLQSMSGQERGKTVNKTREKSPAGNISTIDKAFSIIDFLYEAGCSATIQEISEGLGLYKSTAYRILNAMRAAGYIYQEEKTSKYCLGIRFYQIGLRQLACDNFLQLYIPYAKAINEKYDEVVTVATRELELNSIPRYTVLYGFQSTHVLNLTVGSGSFSPSHCTASGKCLLAYSTERYLQRFYGCELTSYTERTITNWGALKTEFQRIRRDGYAIDDGEYELGLNGVAAPLFAQNGNVVGAISLTCPAERFRKLDLDQVISDLQEVSKIVT